MRRRVGSARAPKVRSRSRDEHLTIRFNIVRERMPRKKNFQNLFSRTGSPESFGINASIRLASGLVASAPVAWPRVFVRRLLRKLNAVKAFWNRCAGGICKAHPRALRHVGVDRRPVYKVG